MKMIYKALICIIVFTSFYFNVFSQATLTIGTTNGTPGNSVTTPVQATGINDMVGFQFTITYDKTKLTYVSCSNWLAGLNASQVQINPLDGKITFVYTDAAVYISSGKFFDLNFSIIDGSSGSASISWSDSPTPRELSNSIPVEISCVYTNGSVAISTAALTTPVATEATSITQTSFSANWNTSATATGYRLDVAQDNAFTNFITGYQNKDVGDVTAYPVSGLSAGTNYVYRVKAYNSGGTSEVSNTINLTTTSPILNAPVATTATNITQTSFSANWNTSATATGYRLDVAQDNAFTNFLTGYHSLDVGNVTAYPVSVLSAGTTYYYRVKAYNSGGTSEVSNTITATTLSNQTGATLTIGNSSGTSGNSVIVPVQATGISDMVGFQFTITYDKTKLNYISCSNWVTGLNASQVQINPLDGKITFVYTDAAVNISNGKFFDLNFTVLNGSSGNAAISWSDSPTQRELSNSMPLEITCVYTNGIVSISDCTPPTSPTSVTPTQTTISSGQSITLQVIGGTLNSAPNWVWYSGSCVGIQIGTGSSISVSPTETTTYYVQASACGTTTTCRSVTINVNNTCTPPALTSHPASQTQTASESASFSISATGSNNFYQWQYNMGNGWYNLDNGSPYSGVNTFDLNISSATIEMSGTKYRCYVSSSCSPTVVTSNEAILTVSNCLPVSIISQPITQYVYEGGTASFSVKIDGSGPLSYYWYKNGNMIYSEYGNNYSSSYTTPILNTGNKNDSYFCVIKNCNNSGQAQSNAASIIFYDNKRPTLVVTPPMLPISTVFTIGLKFSVPVTNVPNGVNVLNGKLEDISGSGDSYVLVISAKEQTTVSIVLSDLIHDLTPNANRFAGETLTYLTGDFSSPQLISFSPNNYEIIANNHPTFKMTFDENINPSYNGTLKIYKVATTVPVLTIPIQSSMISENKVTVTYNITQNGLDKDTRYYVLVDGSALKDNAGNAFWGITDVTSWTFKTGPTFLTSVDNLSSHNFKIYPNPVTNELIIEAENNQNKIDFEIINVTGQVVSSGSLVEKIIVPMNSFVPGMYLIKLIKGDTFEFMKIVKK